MTAELNELSAISVAPGGKLISEPSRFRVVTDEALLPETVWAIPAEEVGYGVLSVQAAGRKKEEDEVEEDDDDADAADDDEDDWDDEDEDDDEWDPDFDEFDLPKSSKKGSRKGDDEEEEDLKIDEDLTEFDDLFGDGGDDFDDDDDDF
jgi:stringent starvation protein B